MKQSIVFLYAVGMAFGAIADESYQPAPIVWDKPSTDARGSMSAGKGSAGITTCGYCCSRAETDRGD